MRTEREVTTSTEASSKAERSSADAHELAPVEHAHLPGERAAVVEQVSGDVAEDDAPAFPDDLEGTEGYRAVASPDVEQGLSTRERSVCEHPVAHGREEVQRGFQVFGVPAVAPLQQPRGPPVSNRLRQVPALFVDRSFRFLATQHGGQVLRCEGGHLVAGLDGGAADVRGEDDVLELQ